MIDPLGSFEQIRENLLLYIRTAFATKFPAVEEERERLLRSQGTLYRDPWIEPLARYEDVKPLSALSSTDAPGLDPSALQELKELAGAALLATTTCSHTSLPCCARHLAAKGQWLQP